MEQTTDWRDGLGPELTEMIKGIINEAFPKGRAVSFHLPDEVEPYGNTWMMHHIVEMAYNYDDPVAGSGLNVDQRTGSSFIKKLDAAGFPFDIQSEHNGDTLALIVARRAGLYSAGGRIVRAFSNFIDFPKENGVDLSVQNWTGQSPAAIGGPLYQKFATARAAVTAETFAPSF